MTKKHFNGEGPVGDPVAPVGIGAASSSMEENLGTGLGLIAGAAAGGVVGPLGMVVGAALGSIIGDAAGASVHEHAAISKKARASGGAPFGLEAEATIIALRAEHADLDALASSVMARVVEGDPKGVREAIADLQARVLAHLDGEERELLVAYGLASPQDARELLREHADIRRALAEFDVAVDLHLLRASTTEDVLRRLRAHAAREDAGLYRWAAQHSA